MGPVSWWQGPPGNINEPLPKSYPWLACRLFMGLRLLTVTDVLSLGWFMLPTRTALGLDLAATLPKNWWLILGTAEETDGIEDCLFRFANDSEQALADTHLFLQRGSHHYPGRVFATFDFSGVGCCRWISLLPSSVRKMLAGGGRYVHSHFRLWFNCKHNNRFTTPFGVEYPSLRGNDSDKGPLRKSEHRDILLTDTFERFPANNDYV